MRDFVGKLLDAELEQAISLPSVGRQLAVNSRVRNWAWYLYPHDVLRVLCGRDLLFRTDMVLEVDSRHTVQYSAVSHSDALAPRVTCLHANAIATRA